MSLPPTRIVPDSGRTNPAIARNNVVFPQPELPRSAIISPRSTPRLTRSSTRVAPYETVRASIERYGGFAFNRVTAITPRPGQQGMRSNIASDASAIVA